jgi:hypothetical protein
MLGDVLVVPKAGVAPVMDGVMDPVWQNVTENILMHTNISGTEPNDWFDMFTSFRLLWDDAHIYGFFYRYDDAIIDENNNPWEQDGIEIYFDADNSKGETYDGLNDIQLRINHWYTAPTDITIGYGTNAGWGFDTNHVTFKNRDMDNGLGWTMEFAIPLESLGFSTPYAGTEFGWEIQVNDNDSDKRDKEAKWWLSTGDDSWMNPSKLGTCMLDGNSVGEELDIRKAICWPAIDGIQEATWLEYPEYSDNTYCWDEGCSFDETTVADWTDCRFRFWAMWGPEAVYFFIKVWDDVKIPEHTNSYESDGIEVYFDGDNSKDEMYDGANDVQLRFERKDVSADDLEAQEWFDRTSVEFQNMERENGWNLEFSIPMDKLGIRGETNAFFGFEIQVNDNDANRRDAMRRWWSWDKMSRSNPSLFGTAVLGRKDQRIPGIPEEATIILPCESGISDKKIEDRSVANRFLLAQNFPNPFNPRTRIFYDLKTAGRVILSMLDLSGREVTVLVDGIQSAGMHEAGLDVRDLASGVYFYRLCCPDGVVTRKMTVAR